MKTLSVLALVTLFATITAQAAEPATGPVKALQPAQVATADTKTPAKAGPISQQDKMRTCNKQATGKKGQERKTFMKSCLSHKA